MFSLPIQKWAWIAGGAVLILLAFYFALDAYGDSRYREGKAKADAEWIAATEKLKKQAEQAGAKADAKAAERATDYAEKVKAEKERIDEAVAEGSSPFDVLFGARR